MLEDDVKSPPVGNTGANILLIDDLRHFKLKVLADLPDDTYLKICRTPESAVQVLESDHRVWDQVWFDHDLGTVDGKIVDVMEVIDYLEFRYNKGNPVPINRFIIHTSNDVGGQNIARALTAMDQSSIVVNAKDFLYVPDYY